MEYENNLLVVDELICDPGLPMHNVIKIGSTFFMVRHTAGSPTKMIAESELKPYKKQPFHGWHRSQNGYEFYLCGMIPRNGFEVTLGNPMSAAEFDAFCAEHNLTDDDISDEYIATCGAIFGEKYAKKFTARQVRVKAAIKLEEKLTATGIHAGSIAPGRVEIRVK